MPFHWLMGTMGTANIQRTLDIIRVYAEFINRPEMCVSPDPFALAPNLTDTHAFPPVLPSYRCLASSTNRKVCPLLFSSLPRINANFRPPNPGNTLGIPILKSFYYHAYQTIREVTGIGRGPVISVHTGFADNSWAGWLPRSDRIALDKHPYLIFGSRQSNDPPVMFARTPCTEWARFHYGMSNTFGLNSAVSAIGLPG